MSMNETANDYALLDVIASLCKNGRSGRLQITVGSTRGAFFFKNGQLVDARVGTLTGFAAVNLAVSMGATVLNFDSSIEPPAPRFNDSHERRLLKTRFGIDAGEAEVQAPHRSGREGRLTLVKEASAPASLEPPMRLPSTTTSVARPNGAGVVSGFSSTQLKKATAPLNVATTPLTSPQAATAPLRVASVPLQEMSSLNVASASPDPVPAALEDTVVPLKIADPSPRPGIVVVQEAVASLNTVGTSPQAATTSMRSATAPSENAIVPLIDQRPAVPRLDASAKKATISLLSRQPPSFVMTHSKMNSWGVQKKLASISPSLQAVQKKLASVSQSLQALGKQSVSYGRNNKTAVRAASIALIVIPVALVFMSYWSKGKETLPLEVSPPTAASLEISPAPAASSLRIPDVAPSKTLSDDQSDTIKPLTKMPSDEVRVRHDAPRSSEAANSVLPTRDTPANTIKTISSETVADGTSETRESGAAEVEPSQAPEQRQLAKPSSRGIAVEVRVEGGRVSEAFIKHRRPGLEGYEATALRLARQRRYPKETTTTETLVFQVSGGH